MTSAEGRPLAGVRVIDTTEERGEMCARLLADLGADVVKVEPPGGSSGRTLPPFAPDGSSLSFAFRNYNKRGVVLDVTTEEGRTELDRLLAGADVWVDGHRPGEWADAGFDTATASKRHPHLVVTAITDFGQTGPYRDFVATDDVMVAIGGMLCRSGELGRPPLLTPGYLAYDVASTTAAFFTLAALWQREQTGEGQHLDVSVMQAVAQITDWSMANYTQIKAAGGLYGQVRNGSKPVYPLYPCADGYVRLIILSPRQWRAMRAWLGEPEILQDDHWDSLLGRMSIQADVLDPMFADLFKDRTAADLADEAQRRGIVMTPVLKPAEVPAMPHFVERGTFVEAEVAPGVVGPIATGFFEIDGERVGYVHRSPGLGEHTDDVAAEDWPSHDAESPGARTPAFPFTGLKVLDFGHGGVGVETGRLFAEYGADVLKVETYTYPDFIRQTSGGMMSPSFASSSRSKRSVGVNVKNPEGAKVIRRLLEWADILIENTSTGTMADMGVPYELVHEINPRLVYASSQLMGSSGPWKDWLGYGPSTRPVGGMTHLWNFADGGAPPGSGAIHPDHLVGRMLALGALAGVIGRQRGGEGIHVEVAQVETVINTLGDLFLKEALEPGSVGPQGNRNERGAPWGVYQCLGEERWCVITIRDDDDWRAFRKALGDPEWASAPELDSVDGRRAAHDELDARIGEWTATRTDGDIMELLQGAGVPAAVMSYPTDLAEGPHSIARNYPRPVEQPPIGELLLEGQAFESDGMPAPYIAAAPMLGEHTRQIAREVLGLTDDEIDALVAAGALEEAPGQP